MKTTNKISPEAVENFCALTGCTVKYRGGGRAHAKHWQFSLNGKRLFFVKRNASLTRLMSLYEHAINPKPKVTMTTGSWSSKPLGYNLQNVPRVYSGKVHENLVQYIYETGKRLWERELVYANLADKAAIHERFTNECTVSATDRCELYGAVGGHGVLPARAIVMDAGGYFDGAEVPGSDQFTNHGADVARGDPICSEQEAESARVLASLPQDVQNLLALHSFIVRKQESMLQIGVCGPPLRWLVSVKDGDWFDAIDNAHVWLDDHPTFP